MSWFSPISRFLIILKLHKRWINLLIWTFCAACWAARLWDGVLRLVLVSFQSNQRNEPLAGPAANTDEGRLAFTESTLEALMGLSAGTLQNTHVWLGQLGECMCMCESMSVCVCVFQWLFFVCCVSTCLDSRKNYFKMNQIQSVIITIYYEDCLFTVLVSIHFKMHILIVINVFTCKDC